MIAVGDLRPGQVAFVPDHDGSQQLCLVLATEPVYRNRWLDYSRTITWLDLATGRVARHTASTLSVVEELSP